MMGQLTYQYKQAWASLRKKPGFIATVVTTMGLTLGSLLCVFTLAYYLLAKPLPYPDQDRLFLVDHVMKNSEQAHMATAFTYPGLIHLYENQDSFDTTALAYYGQDVLTSLPNQPTLNTTYVSPEWFPMLGAEMELGRAFESTEAVDTNQPVAILSYKTWHDEFAQAPDIIGKKVEFSGISFRVIGVLAEHFFEPQIRLTGRETGVWFPWDYNLAQNIETSWSNISGSLTFVGKLKVGLSPSQAEQQLKPIVNDTWVEKVSGMSFFDGWTVTPELQSMKVVILGDRELTVWLLLAGVIGLVLIATANIANLFVSRTAEQRRKLAIFAALGAKKSKLFTINFAETSLLMGLAFLLALLISSLGFYLLQQFLSSELPRVNELELTGLTLFVAVFISFIFASLFSALTNRMINYKGLNSLLQSSGKGTGVQVSKKLRQFLIVSQVAIATVLVFANISLFEKAYSTITESRGYNIANMTQLSLSASTSQYPSADEIKPVMQDFRTKLSELPQVESVSLNSGVFSGYGLWALITKLDNRKFTPIRKRVDETYFQTIGQELLEGDYFSLADVRDGNQVMIVNDVFAKQLNPNGSVLGMQMSQGGDNAITIIGVVKGIKLPGTSDIPGRVFTPSFMSTTTFTINLLEDKNITREQVVSVLSQVSSLYAVFSLERLVDTEDEQLFTEYATAVTTAALTVITLFLAGVGLYGILSYGTQMRRFELGTRMAIGAKKRHLVAMVVKDNSSVILLGVLVSIVILVGLYFTYYSIVANYLNIDLIFMFLLTLMAIAGLSLFACYWPLRTYINQPAVHSLRGSD